MSEFNRRSFMKTTAMGVAGAATLASLNTARADAGNQVRLGLIGCGGRGTAVARSFAELENVELVSVCDPDVKRASAAVASIDDRPQIANDLRKILDDKTIDGVIVATPDHWHAPAAILAVEAGKHVYVEKPCSHNVREGRLLVAAARRHERHVQHGTQSRSSSLLVHAVDLLRQGIIGDVLMAKAWNVQKRGPIGRAKPSDPPAGFDYDTWVGPAPLVPFQSNRHHYSWHWWYDFGTGDTGNDGVHEIDIARWGLGDPPHPTAASALGGKFAFDDDQQFPDTQLVSFDYPGDGQVGNRRQLVFEMRLWSRYGLEGVDNGNAFYGTKGWMLLSKRGILKVFDDQNRELELKPPDISLTNHFENFIDAIRGADTLRAEIEVGHGSATLCHLANISTRLGRTIRFDPERERVLNDAEADALLTRAYRDGHWAVPKDVA